MKKELPSLEDMLFQILGDNGLTPDEIKKTVNDAMTSKEVIDNQEDSNV